MKEETRQNTMTPRPRGKFDKEKKYWEDKLSGLLKPGGFPVDYARTGCDQHEREKLTFRFPDEIFNKLVSLSHKSQDGIFIILTAGLNYLLFKYTGDEDIIIGSPVLTQREYGANKTRFLVLRNLVKPGMTFKDLLLQVKTTVSEANENTNYYPFNEIIQRLNLSTRNNSSRYFDTMIVFKNIHDQSLFNDQKPDTLFFFDMTEKHLECEINYDSALFSHKTVEYLGKHFINSFTAITQNPTAKLSGIDILSREEKQQILYQFNNTKVNYPQYKTINQLFEEQVEKTPANTAVVFEDNRLTYRELNGKANRFARMLKQEYGVGEDHIVPIQVPRSLEMVIGMIGILKANAVCLPLETGYPQERVRLFLKDSAAKVLIKNIRSQRLDEIEPVNINIENTRKPDSLAYVFYTSGSTGSPKGVLLHHRGINNNIFSKMKELQLRQDDIFCHNLRFNFAASVWQIFAPLYSGNTLVLYPEDVMMNTYELFKRVKHDEITILEVVPSVLNTYLEQLQEGKTAIDLKQLRMLVLTGEEVPPSLVNKFYSRYKIDLMNAYGQTEYTDDATYYKIPFNPDTKKVPIGKPANNTRLYILDNQAQLLPLGAAGELYISGDGLALGYLNNPVLTAEKFILNPYNSKPGERMFKTGDLARWLPNGNIEFFGRKDHQVKIRGHRIELGEIESRLLSHDQVKEAVVVVRGDEENKYLCAYIIPRFPSPSPGSHDPVKAVEISELREYLSRYLPVYMVPAHFVPMEQLPLTPNGKVDRKMLPEPELKAEKDVDQPGDEIEKELVRIWSEVLRIKAHSITLHHNFFEVGGNSLKAVTLVSKIHKELNVDISLTDIFEMPTIKGLSQIIKGAAVNKYVSIEALEEKEYYPLSSAQKRIYILQQMDIEGTSYNAPVFLELEGMAAKEKLAATFKKLIQRHESLRTSFEMIDEKPVQIIHDEMEFKIEYLDVGDRQWLIGNRGEPFGQINAFGEKSNHKGHEEFSMDHLIRRFVRSFDLSQAPLLRVGLIRQQQHKHILIVDMHHIITDGTSLTLFVKEFMVLYANGTLPALRIQYRDYAGWHNMEKQKEAIKQQEVYWLKQFRGEIPVLNLPTDYPRPVVQSFEGNTLGFGMSIEHSRGLNDLALRTGTTLYMVLLAIYNILLSKISGQEDIVVGTDTAGRRHADLEKIIGMFVNTLAMRNYPHGDTTFKDFLIEVKERTLAAFENQEYQFEDLVDRVVLTRDPSRNPLFDVMFSLPNLETPTGETTEPEIPGLKITPYESENLTAKFDLNLTCIQPGEKLFLTFEYCRKLFKEETVKKFMDYFMEIVETVIGNSDIKLKDIPISHDLLTANTNMGQVDFGF